MANPVVVADLVARWRPLSSAELVNAQAFLDDAWEELLVRVPSIESRLASGDLRPGLVVKTVIAAVKAVMLNPEGLKEEHLGDYGYSRDDATSRQFFSDADIELLSPGAVSGSGAFSIAPSWCAP